MHNRILKEYIRVGRPGIQLSRLGEKFGSKYCAFDPQTHTHTHRLNHNIIPDLEEEMLPKHFSITCLSFAFCWETVFRFFIGGYDYLNAVVCSSPNDIVLC